MELTELDLNRQLYKTQPQTIETLGADVVASTLTPPPSTAIASGNSVTDVNTNAEQIDGAVIAPGTIPPSTLDIANFGWTQTCAFTVTDADTVSWGSGTFTSADGVNTYSIGAGNTGNMTLKTYVYLDINVSTTAYQVTTNITTPIGIGKVLIAVCQNGSVTATYVLVQATQVIADNIIANTITAEKMSVAQLSAITADMGALTAGTITLNSSGHIKSGQTAYNTGTGFFLGVSSAVTKFSLGDPTGRYLTWDGVDLVVNGYTVIQQGTFGGDGSDGVLTITSGTTTINLASATYVTKNYTSISITGTGALNFSNPNSQGTIVVLKAQEQGGGVTLTSSAAPMIDASGIGAAGGTGGTGSGSGNGNTGNIGNSGNNAITSPITGGTGGIFGTLGAGGAGGTSPTGLGWLNSIAGKLVQLACGSGGGGGGSGYAVSATAPTGGRGGGALYIECAGALNFTTASGISVAGVNGGGSAGTRAGGAGGGAGGSCVILYTTLTAGSGTITATGGTGSAGGSGGAGSGCGGGGGGGSNNVAGTAGAAGDTTTGGTGGDGAAGFTLVVENTAFA